MAVNQGGVQSIAGVVLPLDSVEEFSLQTQAGPETGRNPGGTVNMVIKSGTNQLHGSAYYYNRNEALAARTPFAPQVRRRTSCATSNTDFRLVDRSFAIARSFL